MWDLYFWSSVSRHGCPHPDLPRLATIPLRWSGGMLRLKIVQNERLINFFRKQKCFVHNLIHNVSNYLRKVLSSNHITGLFDHQDIWKEAISALDLLRRGRSRIRKKKIASTCNYRSWLVVARSAQLHPGLPRLVRGEFG